MRVACLRVYWLKLASSMCIRFAYVSQAFMLTFFFLKHAEEFHRRRRGRGASASRSTPTLLAPRPPRTLHRPSFYRPASSAFSRDFSRHARWMMREFNELPHIFEVRRSQVKFGARARLKTRAVRWGLGG